MRRSRQQQASIICLRAERERMNRGLRLFTFNEAFAWQHLTTALCEQFEPAPPQAAAQLSLRPSSVVQ
jgi:hypothetical protein